MTKLLLTQYRLEFEHSDITMEELVSKYKLDLSELTGYEEWSKGGHTDLVLDTSSPHVDIVPPPVTVSDEEKIKQFKTAALDHCLNFMVNDIRFAEVKEFKDIVNIVDTIDKKDRGDNNTTINILMQNITEKFIDDV